MLDLITNRTNEDTYYNSEDFNRVEAATRYLADVLTAAGYVVTISVKINWTMNDKPTNREMKRYIANINKCITQYCKVPGATLPESMKNLDYIGANNIEKILAGLEVLIENMKSTYRYPGTFYAGHSGLRGYCL
ncbi:MAG: hypothetical protein PHW03_07250 [Eubacteriales bacterium]|nr:hypothetical protein [Eubacteriales bacterium]